MKKGTEIELRSGSQSFRRNTASSCTMGNGDNRSHIFDTIISCLLRALSSFARRKHFSAYIYNVSPI